MQPTLISLTTTKRLPLYVNSQNCNPKDFFKNENLLNKTKRAIQMESAFYYFLKCYLVWTVMSVLSTFIPVSPIVFKIRLKIPKTETMINIPTTPHII